MGNKALVIIDVQEGLFGEPPYDIYESEKLIKNISELIRNAREAKVPIIFVQHNDDFLSLNSQKWQIHKKINRSEEDTYVNKQKCDSFFGTNLQEVLTEGKIDQIVVCGLQTEYCVDTACRSAVSKGIKTILVKDAHSTFNSKILSADQIIDHHNKTLSDGFVELVATQTLEF